MRIEIGKLNKNLALKQNVRNFQQKKRIMDRLEHLNYFTPRVFVIDGNEVILPDEFGLDGTLAVDIRPF